MGFVSKCFILCLATTIVVFPAELKAQVLAPAFLECGNGIPVQVDCDNDCQQEHGAISGTCNYANACVCHYGGDTLTPGPNSYVPVPSALVPIKQIPIQQCQLDDRTVINSLTPIYTAYVLGCNLDCQCIHGATNGTCDFNTHKCHCNYASNATFDNINNGNCPYCALGSAQAAISSLFGQLDNILTDLTSLNNPIVLPTPPGPC